MITQEPTRYFSHPSASGDMESMRFYALCLCIFAYDCVSLESMRCLEACGPEGARDRGVLAWVLLWCVRSDSKDTHIHTYTQRVKKTPSLKSTCTCPSCLPYSPDTSIRHLRGSKYTQTYADIQMRKKKQPHVPHSPHAPQTPQRLQKHTDTYTTRKKDPCFTCSSTCLTRLQTP